MKFLMVAAACVCLSTSAGAATFQFEMTATVDRFSTFNYKIDPINITPPTSLKVGDAFSVRYTFDTNVAPTSLFDADPSINIYYVQLKEYQVKIGSFVGYKDVSSGTIQLWNDYISSNDPVDYFGISGGYYLPAGASPFDFGGTETFVSASFDAFDRTGKARRSDLISELPSLSNYTTSSSSVSGSVGFVNRDSDRIVVVGLRDLKASLTPLSAVPEPSTWALMILGFGVIGYAMRRKTVLRYV